MSFKINGFTDSHTECDRCGRADLKGTWNIETSEGQIFHLGSDCIKKAYQMTQKEFIAKVDVDYSARRRTAREIYFSTPEYKAQDAYQNTYVQPAGQWTHPRTQFDIDRELYGWRYVSQKGEAAKAIQQRLVTEFNLKGTYEL